VGWHRPPHRSQASPHWGYQTVALCSNQWASGPPTSTPPLPPPLPSLILPYPPLPSLILPYPPLSSLILPYHPLSLSSLLLPYPPPFSFHILPYPPLSSHIVPYPLFSPLALPYNSLSSPFLPESSLVLSYHSLSSLIRAILRAQALVPPHKWGLPSPVCWHRC
jgi:hypothetical protein